jgi:glycosyltransferase involved in cell wall biosynthesis
MTAIILVGFGPPFTISTDHPQLSWLIRRNRVYSQIQIANAYARVFDKVWLLAYDYQTYAKQYDIKPAANVTLLFRPRSIPALAYGILAPIIYRRQFRTANIYKTFELRGTITALISRFLYGNRVILRQTYQVSEVIKAVQLAGGSPPFRSWIYRIIMVSYELVSSHIANAVQVASTAHKDYLIRKFRVPSRKIFVIPNWVDTRLFRSMRTAGKEKGRVVFVGRFVVVKNVFSLVEAMTGIRDAKLYLIGDGSLRMPLEQKLSKEKIKNVILLGAVPHNMLPAELNKSEIFVLPSLFEGNPRALLEAMSCGLPAIGPNTKEIRGLIKDGFSGLLCNPDAGSIRSKISELLSDPALRRKLGANARKQVEKNHTFRHVLTQELRVLDSVLKGESR